MSAGFVKVIAQRLVGKYVEIYQGITHDQKNWSEIEIQRKSVIFGKLLEVVEECLILEVEDEYDHTKVDIYINSWSIQTILEVKKGFSIYDVYFPDERKNSKKKANG